MQTRSPTSLIYARARAMRANPTRAERVLWGRLRKGQIDGYKFRRQHPLPPFILDFYCVELGVAIELDGLVHQGARRVGVDEHRDAELDHRGILVLRFSNDRVLNHLGEVLRDIHDSILERRVALHASTCRRR